MELGFVKERPAVILFIFFGALLSGLVLIGICSSFSLMLTERGISAATVTTMMLATLPYSWKFAISPFVKNLIIKYKNSEKDIVKILAYISQIVIFIGVSSLGLFENRGSLILAVVVILTAVIAISIHDILINHLKLILFDSKEFGYVTAIENAGFRLGMFIAGACIIYIANSTGWFGAFLTVASIVLFAAIATFFMKDHQNCKQIYEEQTIGSINQYLNVCVAFFRKYGIFALLLVVIAFKTTDSCVSVLKPMFMHHLGVSRSAFANIAHLYGLISMVTGGAVAGFVIYRLGFSLCVKTTFFAQMLVSLIYMYVSSHKVDILILGILVNISTFIFGFSGVVFRTMISQESRRDVNMYTILVSIGSLVRIGSYPFAGEIVEHFSWETMYFLCLLSNIPGFFMIARLKKTS